MVDFRKPGKVGGLGVDPNLSNKKIESKESSQTQTSRPSSQGSSFIHGGKGQAGSNSGGLMRSGAMGIFSDGIIFPQNLLDTHNPQNDPKYLRLLSAALGMSDLEWHFKTREEEDQEEYILRKEKRRVERMQEREGEESDQQEQKEDSE